MCVVVKPTQHALSVGIVHFGVLKVHVLKVFNLIDNNHTNCTCQVIIRELLPSCQLFSQGCIIFQQFFWKNTRIRDASIPSMSVAVPNGARIRSPN
jgi:hypothetical protein